jgi:hypothetical protein
MPLTVMMSENVGASYSPAMECATEDPETDCYLLNGGAVFTASWYQPIEADSYEGNFRLTADMEGTAVCVYNNSLFGESTFISTGATSTMVGAALIATAVLQL